MTHPIVPFRKPHTGSLTSTQSSSSLDPSMELIRRIELDDHLVPIQMRSLITQMRTQNESRMAVILEDLSNFSRNSTRLLERLDTLIQRIAADEEDPQVTQIATTVMQVTKTTMRLLNDSVRHCLALQAKGRSVLTTSTSQVLYCLLEARAAELSHFQENLELCYKQEDHDLATRLEMATQVMTLESSHFNHILDLSDAKEHARVRKLEHEDAMAAEDRAHSTRLAALAQEKVSLHSAHQTYMQTLDAIARCQIAALISELKK